MNFYRRRPLAAAISLCIAVSAAAAFLSAAGKLWLMLSVAVLAPMLAAIFRAFKVKRLFNMPSAAFIFLSAALTLCMLLVSFGFYNVHAEKYANLSDGRIEAVITDVRSSGYRSIYKIRLRSLNGENMNASGILLDELCDPLALGDIIQTDAVFAEFGDIYDYYDMPRLSTMAEGLMFACESTDELRVVGRDSGAETTLARWRSLLGAKMSLYLDGDSAALSKALMLGERDGLGKIRRDFTYIGVTHILALSGLHLTVISGAIERILVGVGIGRRFRNITLITILLFYTLLVGLLMSVVRAAIMISLSLLAGIFNRESDRVTSLFAAVWLIALVNPAALFDISLQLSFFATLGVILLNDSAKRTVAKQKIGRGAASLVMRRFRGILMSVFASVGAILFILPLLWLYFGEISTLSVPATLIMSVVCEGLLIVLLPYTVFAALGFNIGAAGLAPIISVLCTASEKCASALAEQASLISLRYSFALPIILCLAAVIVIMMMVDVKSWLYSLIPLFMACAVFLGCASVYEHAHLEDMTVDFMNNENNDAFLVISQRKAMITDVTDGSSASMNDVRAVLAKRNLTNVDTVVLTRITRRHISPLRSLLGYRKVGRLILPIPEDEYTYFLFETIRSMAEEYGTEVVIYSPDSETNITFKGASLFIPKRTVTKRSAHPLELLIFSGGDTEILYFGTAAWENEYLWSLADGAEHIIVGKNGPSFLLPPEGHIWEDAKHIAFPDESTAGRFAPWLDGYSGKMSCGAHHYIDITP